MKSRLMIPVFAALVLVTGAATHPVLAGMEGFVGATLPSGDFGDMAKTGYHLGGAYTIPVGPTASIGAWGAYHLIGIEDPVGGDANMLQLMGIARISAPMGPFGQVGLGLASMKYEPDEATAMFSEDRETDLVFAIGGGYNMSMLKITAMYHSISSEGSSTNMITVSAGLGF
jgi:hypothetical protein